MTNPSQHSCLKNSHGDAHEWVASLDRTYVFVLVIEVSCARPWIQSWPTIRFCNVPVSLRDTKIYEEKRSGNKIRSLGIPVGETLSRSLRPFVPLLTFVSNKHDFELYLSNYILREAKSISSFVHLPSNKFYRLMILVIQYEYIIISFILGISSADKRIWWHCAISIYISIDNLTLIMQSKVIESRKKKWWNHAANFLIDLVIVREENSPPDKTHYRRFCPRNVVERCVTRRCVIRRLSCALSNEFRLERSAQTLNRGCDGGIIRDTVSIPNSHLALKPSRSGGINRDD